MWRAIGFALVGADIFLAGMFAPLVVEAQQPIDGVAIPAGTYGNFRPDARIDSTTVRYADKVTP